MSKIALLSFEEIITELYHGVLGRAPDPGGLRHHVAALAKGGKLSDVMREFLGSEEFFAQQREGGYQAVDQEPALSIELGLSSVQLSRLWTHIAANWSKLGEVDPYWSVLVDPRFRIGNMDDADVLALFYESGLADVVRLEAWLGRNGLSLGADMVCAEYGCGVGRLTSWLAERCGQVRAFDISAAHVRKAQDWVTSRGQGNVDFRVVSRPRDLGRMGGVDLFFSVIVLQHNPPPIMHFILSEAFRQIKPGGIAYFQLPTYMRGYRFDLTSYLAGIDDRGTMEMHCLPQRDVFALAAEHGLVPLEVEQDGSIGASGTSHIFLFQKLKAQSLLGVNNNRAGRAPINRR